MIASLNSNSVSTLSNFKLDFEDWLRLSSIHPMSIDKNVWTPKKQHDTRLFVSGRYWGMIKLLNGRDTTVIAMLGSSAHLILVILYPSIQCSNDKFWTWFRSDRFIPSNETAIIISLILINLIYPMINTIRIICFRWLKGNLIEIIIWIHHHISFIFWAICSLIHHFMIILHQILIWPACLDRSKTRFPVSRKIVRHN